MKWKVEQNISKRKQALVSLEVMAKAMNSDYTTYFHNFIKFIKKMNIKSKIEKKK